MFNFWKKAATNESIIQEGDIVSHKYPPLNISSPDRRLLKAQDAVEIARLLVRFAIIQKTLGMAEEDVLLLIKARGASEDVALLALAKATESLATN